MDGLGQLLFGIAAVITATGGLLAGRRLGRQQTARELRQCRRERLDLRDRVSSLETAMSAIVKLLPPGEWYLKLGLGEHPRDTHS